MIRFDKDNIRFNYRVVGAAFRDNCVLLHHATGDDFWSFPGGRAEFGEEATETLKREMREEIDADVEVIRLLWFVENFFNYAGMNYHEIALYFLMRLPETHKFMVDSGPFLGQEEQVELTFQWFPNDSDVLAKLPLFPKFLPTKLQNLPEAPEHIVQYD